MFKKNPGQRPKYCWIDEKNLNWNYNIDELYVCQWSYILIKTLWRHFCNDGA